jgi:hypothetical protein
MNGTFNSASDPAEQLLEMQNRVSPQHFWGSREMFYVLSTILLLAAILFLWTFLFHRPRRHSLARSLGGNASAGEILRDPRDRHEKKRRRRWARRNPTLAETGGLPPPKGENPKSDPH